MSTGVKYEPTNSVASGSTPGYKSFTYYDDISKIWKSLETNASKTVENEYYYYYPTTLTETDEPITATVGIGVNTPEYKMLFTNSSTGAGATEAGKSFNFDYWLGSKCVTTNEGCIRFGFRFVYWGIIRDDDVYYSNDRVYALSYGIRPVVTLDSKVNLKDSGTMKDGCKLYNMTV